MAQTPTLNPEAGWNSTLELHEGQVIKTSPLEGVYASATEAETVVAGLRAYAGELADEPLRTATFYGAEAVPVDGGYKVQHTYGYVDGPSMNRLQPGELQPAMATLLGQVAGMKTIQGPNTLQVPFDAKAQNFHVDAEGPTLIDIFPALSRRPDGSFPTEYFPGEPKKGGFVAWSLGTKSGAMSALLSTAIDRGDGATSKLQHILRNRDDWAYDVLPGDLDAKVKAAVRRQITTHFVPFFTRGAVKKARNHLGL